LKQFNLNLPDELYSFIEKKVEEGKFTSIEHFILHAVSGLAELYGFSETITGKKLSDLLTDIFSSKISTITPSVQKVETVVKEHKIPNMNLILESFSSSKFMYEDALYTACVFSRMKKGEQPLSKEEFTKTLSEMEKAGVLSKIEQNGKLMWKRN